VETLEERALLNVDFGDAPDPSYPTLWASNGASHVIDGPWLGDLSDAPDADADGRPDMFGLGDDALDGNDENGVTIRPLAIGSASNITVEVNSVGGTGGVLEAWIDFDRDGVWQHTGERIFAGSLPDGVHQIPVTAPAQSVVGMTFARFRISTAGGLAPGGLAADGEVEDHAVFIEPAGSNLDWGDAPDPDYPTLSASNGASHVIGGPWLGDVNDAPDGEVNGQPQTAALGDDMVDGSDDEQGVTIPTLAIDSASNISVEVNSVGGTGGVLQAWIDFDGDGTWQHPDEQIFAGFLADGTHSISVTPPVGSSVGGTFARFRISTAGGLAPDGPADNGEVEDHEVFIASNSDWGDAPDSYRTLSASNGASHLIGGPWLGDLTDAPDADPGGQPDMSGLGDDRLDGTDDEDGVTIPALAVGSYVNIMVEVNSEGATGGVLQGWIDFNRDGTWQDPDERIFAGFLPDGVHPIPVTPPVGSPLGQTFARFRISTAGGLAPDGSAADGEVEDHTVLIEAAGSRLDWGDAPDPTYPTLSANNGASHVIVGPFLGDLTDAPDGEADGKPHATALGDDVVDGADDEDGVTIPLLAVGAASNIRVEVNSVGGTGGVVDAWIDFDADGTWQHPGERIFSSFLADGVHSIPVTPPAESALGQTFARFRISTAGGLAPGGAAPDGEVEDHEAFIEEATVHSSVVGRHVFYNNSYFDGMDPEPGASDDHAIPPAPDVASDPALGKTALLPGQTATRVNYTSYSRGINGIMVDIANLADAAGLSAADFEFHVGNAHDPSTWDAGPGPTSVTVRAGAGDGGSDRVTLLFSDGDILKQWLQVTVKANAKTGLSVDDVFYYGNAVGESLDTADFTFVDGTDFAGARDNRHESPGLAAIDDAYDFNRDSLVDDTDLTIARDNSTNFLTSLKLITAPSSGGGASSVSFGSSFSSSSAPALQLGEASSAVDRHVVTSLAVSGLDWAAESSADSSYSRPTAADPADSPLLATEQLDPQAVSVLFESPPTHEARNDPESPRQTPDNEWLSAVDELFLSDWDQAVIGG